LLWEELDQTAYLSGPYRQPVLGTPESLERIDAAALRDYYDRHYAPGACLLVVAGDVTEDALLSALIHTFVNDRRPADGDSPPPPPTERAEGVSRRIDKDVKEAYLALAWPAPPIARREDVYAMDVLTCILGNGRSSRLYREVKDRRRLVSTIGAHCSPQAHPSLLTVSATLPPGGAGAAREAILEQIRRVRQGVSGREVRRARRMIRAGLEFALETPAGRARSIGYYRLLTGSDEFLNTYLDRIENVCAADVVRVAREYLDPDKAVEVLIAPPGQ